VKVTLACLGELTMEGEKEAKHGSLFEMLLRLKSEKYRSAKNRENDRVLRYHE